jgi:hypothetical protein
MDSANLIAPAAFRWVTITPHAVCAVRFAETAQNRLPGPNPLLIRQISRNRGVIALPPGPSPSVSGPKTIPAPLKDNLIALGEIMLATIIKSTLLGLTLGVALAFAASRPEPDDQGGIRGLSTPLGATHFSATDFSDRPRRF